MRGTVPQPERELTQTEQHLGDRLAALIDGELGHDARERVLAHLATCRSCKTEADAQRRVKNVFADTAPPPPSDGLLARLQGLPAAGPADGPFDGTPSGGDGARLPGSGSRGALSDPSQPMANAESGGSVWAFDQLRGGRGGSALSPGRGFRIHEMERLSARGRRFAFAAAGAVSLAALALAGGVGTAGTAGSGSSAAKGDAGAASASSVRTANATGGSDRDRRRRDASAMRTEVSGTVLSASTTAGDSSGAALKAGHGSGLHRGAPWAAPTAPPAEGERAGTSHPLLREAFLSSLALPTPPSAATGAYGFGAESYAGLPADAFPGGAIRKSAPSPSAVTTAAPPRR
ncbi:anti-sigma factor family protein [Streptomyces abyssalis]|nr:zf-HC2 domain-containing protein [Streptomyces abyssalis]